MLLEHRDKPPAFTQGIHVFPDGSYYESSGLYGSSYLQYISPRHPAQSRRCYLSDKVFAEGLTYLDGSIYQLTYKENWMLVWDHRLELKEVISYPLEGWGLTHNPTTGQLWSTDGTDKIYALSRTLNDSFDAQAVRVYSRSNPQTVYSRLNDIEYCPAGTLSRSADLILACQWMTPYVYAIDAGTGLVVRTLDFQELVDSHRQGNPEACLNGLSYGGDGSFWITGKYWNRMYRFLEKF